MGYAYGYGEVASDWGHVTLTNKTGFSRNGRFARFLSFLEGWQKSVGYFSVVYESVTAFGNNSRQNSMAAPVVYGGWLATLEIARETLGIPLYCAAVGSIRKEVTGSGRAKKDAVRDAVRGFGYDVTNHNASDALAVFCYARGVRVKHGRETRQHSRTGTESSCPGQAVPEHETEGR